MTDQISVRGSRPVADDAPPDPALPPAPAPVRLRRGEARGLRRAAARDARRGLPEIVPPGPGLTPTITRLLLEGGEGVARVRGAATRELAPLLRQLTRTGVQARLARTDLDAPVPDLGERALPPTDVQRRRGEDGLTDWDVRRRRHAENARERQRVIASRHRLEAVLGALLNRQAVLRADIDARVRLAQAAGLLCHHSALARIGYYAEHLIREHADGSELVQVGWPPLPEPPSWLHDDREAAQLLTGHRVHALDAGQPEAWSENAD